MRYNLYMSFLIDKEGRVVSEYVYDAWGNLLSSSGSLVQPYQYLSYYSEVDIGLYLIGRRWYDPEVGRYISRNFPYVFSNNNPITSKDTGSLRIVDRNVAIYIPPSEQKSKKGFYGNWCGRGWSGGKYTDDPKEVDWSVPAIDSIDQCCKEHDACFQNYALKSNTFLPCENRKSKEECNKEMCNCLKRNVNPQDVVKHKWVYIALYNVFCVGGFLPGW